MQAREGNSAASIGKSRMARSSVLQSRITEEREYTKRSVFLLNTDNLVFPAHIVPPSQSVAMTAASSS